MAWPSDLIRTKNWGSEVLTDTDLEGQFDLIIAYVDAMMDGTSGHGHSGGSNDGKNIPLTTGVTGTLPVANGGTGLTTLAALMNLIYPIGTVLTFGVATNPATLLGVGTWTAIEGKVIVGISASDSEFDTLDETGGAKTVTLDTTMIPSHSHTISGLKNSNGAGTLIQESASSGGSGGTPSTDATGGGAAHNNLQPYQVKYIWQRVS